MLLKFKNYYNFKSIQINKKLNKDQYSNSKQELFMKENGQEIKDMVLEK